MNKNLILSLGVVVILASCNNNAVDNAREEALLKDNKEADLIANQAIRDSGVHVEYTELDKFTNQRPAASGILESEPLRTNLRKLLGKEYQNFMEAMSEATELRKDSTFFTTWGTLPDDAIRGISYIIIDAKTRQIGAYQNIEGKVQTWGFVSDSSYVPATIKKKIADFK